MSKLKVGDRVRLKARLLNGYQGEATVLLIDHKDGLEDLFFIWPDDGTPPPMYGQHGVASLRSDLVKVRKPSQSSCGNRPIPDRHINPRRASGRR